MSSYYSTYNSGNSGRKAVVFVGIVAAHVLLAWAFINGTLQRVVKAVAPPIVADLLEEQKQEEKPPPPPPVVVQERPPVQVVTPDINISIPVEAPPPPITNVTTQPVAPVAPPRAPVVVGTGLVTTYAPNSEDYYPPAAKREEREGRPVVHLCVSSAGKITSVDIKQSSGSPDLDEGAVKLGKAMRFKPATAEGKPIDACKDIAVKFEMKKK
ncbi:MAG: energy transducer TonB [Steroidobacteraceae bacterium]